MCVCVYIFIYLFTYLYLYTGLYMFVANGYVHICAIYTLLKRGL